MAGNKSRRGNEPTKRETTTNKGDMTVREAGRMGGETVRDKYGPEFFSEIGQKGGEIGGQVRKEQLGHEGYVELGHKGGETVRDKYGPEFYSEIGHKGGEKVRELIEEAKRNRGEEE